MAYNRKTGLYEGWIYKIYTTKTPYVYIGQTKRKYSTRWKEHIDVAMRENYDDYIEDPDRPDLHYDMHRYGIDYFIFEVIEQIEDEKQSVVKNRLDELEKYYIELYDSYYNGYNNTRGGAGFGGYGTPVVAYDTNGNYLFETRTILDMSDKVGVSPDVISRSCSGKTVPKADYVFRNKGDAFDLYRTNKGGARATEIYLFDSEGKYIRRYDRILDAADDLQFDYQNVFQSMKFKRVYNGYFFSDSKVFNPIYRTGNSEKVDIYDYQTKEFVGTFDSISSGLRYVGKSSANSIKSAKRSLNGETEQSLGYIWRYHGQPLGDNKVYHRLGVMKPIVAYTINKEYVGVYPNQVIAAKELNLQPPSINNCLAKRQNQTKGYLFYYANDESQPDKTKITNMTAKEVIEKYGYVV